MKINVGVVSFHLRIIKELLKKLIKEMTKMINFDGLKIRKFFKKMTKKHKLNLVVLQGQIYKSISFKYKLKEHRKIKN